MCVLKKEVLWLSHLDYERFCKLVIGFVFWMNIVDIKD